jgi:hypothetical protein
MEAHAGHGERALKRQIEVREKAISALKDYSFDPEHAAFPWPPGLVVGGIMWGV